MNEKKILEKEGWKVECEHPFEIRNEDGSFASGLGANFILSTLIEKHTKKSKKKKKKVLEKDLKDWDVYKASTGNVFIKLSNNYAIAIGRKDDCVPDMKVIYSPSAQRNFEDYTLLKNAQQQQKKKEMEEYVL